MVWPTGDCVDGATVLAQKIAKFDGVRCTIEEQIGSANGAVVVYLRHLA